MMEKLVLYLVVEAVDIFTLKNLMEKLFIEVFLGRN